MVGGYKLKNNRSYFTKRFNKRGQVFILLALVILLYLILLSLTMYDITRIPYIEPSANQQQTEQYIDNTISSLYELNDIAISQYSHGTARSAIISNYENGLNGIKEFLQSHNIIAHFSLDKSSFRIVNSSSSDNPVNISCSALVTFSIENTAMRYKTTILVSTSYFAEISDISGTTNYVYCYMIRHNSETSINNCTITVTPSTNVLNLGDGRYQLDLQSGQVLKILFPHNILLYKQI